MVPWVGLQCVIVVFPDHTLLIFGVKYYLYKDCFYIVYILYVFRGAIGWSDCGIILTHFFHPCIGLDKTHF